MELERAERALEERKIRLENDKMPLNGFAIVMIVMTPFIFVIIALIIVFKQRNKESKRRYDLYSKSLEMGQSIPEHFFDEPKKANQASNFKKGAIWLAIGLGIFISIIISNETDVVFLGLIPTFVGVGYLLVHFLDKPKKTDEQNG